MVADTGILIEHLRAKDNLSSNLYRFPEIEDIHISAVPVYELHVGATTMDKKAHVETITESFTVLPFTNAIALKLHKYTITFA